MLDIAGESLTYEKRLDELIVVEKLFLFQNGSSVNYKNSRGEYQRYNR
jgi:hypothetical protein